MTREEFLSLAFQKKFHNPELRLGQAAFNLAFELFPEWAEMIRSSEADPFFLDEKIEIFLKSSVEHGVLDGAPCENPGDIMNSRNRNRRKNGLQRHVTGAAPSKDGKTQERA